MRCSLYPRLSMKRKHLNVSSIYLCYFFGYQFYITLISLLSENLGFSTSKIVFYTEYRKYGIESQNEIRKVVNHIYSKATMQKIATKYLEYWRGQYGCIAPHPLYLWWWLCEELNLQLHQLTLLGCHILQGFTELRLLDSCRNMFKSSRESFLFVIRGKTDRINKLSKKVTPVV